MTSRGMGRAVKDRGLSDELRSEIVTRLAMFDRQVDIVKDLTERGIVVTKQAISNYMPENNRRLAQRWVELFHKTRTDFLSEVAAEPISSRAYRLRQLGKIHELEMRRGNTTGARAALEQAAKEIGNVYTNVAKVQGAVLPGQVLDQNTPADEMRNMLSDRIGEFIGEMKRAKIPAPGKTVN